MNQLQIKYINSIKNGVKNYFPETAKEHVELIKAFSFYNFNAANFRAIFPFTWYTKEQFYIIADFENQTFNIQYTGG